MPSTSANVAGSDKDEAIKTDDRRELAIEVHDDDIVHRLQNIARHDWEYSSPLDLTDEGLFVDLEKHGHGGAEQLVLRMDNAHEKKHKK